MIDLVILKAAEEESLLLDDRATDSKAILVELQFRPLPTFVIAEPLVGVVIRIPVEVKHRAVKGVRTGLHGNDHIRAAIASLLSGRAEGDGAKLLDIVGIQALDITLRIGHRGLISINAVNRDIMSSITRAKHVGVGTGTVGGALHHTWFQRQQRERVAAIEG